MGNHASRKLHLWQKLLCHDTIDNGDDTNKSNGIETRNHPVTGQQHPYDKASIFFSRFPLRFLDCFNYGQLGHRNTRDYPNARGSILINRRFS